MTIIVERKPYLEAIDERAAGPSGAVGLARMEHLQRKWFIRVARVALSILDPMRYLAEQIEVTVTRCCISIQVNNRMGRSIGSATSSVSLMLSMNQDADTYRTPSGGCQTHRRNETEHRSVQAEGCEGTSHFSTHAFAKERSIFPSADERLYFGRTKRGEFAMNSKEISFEPEKRILTTTDYSELSE